jgi:hypothetical protein
VTGWRTAAADAIDAQAAAIQAALDQLDDAHEVLETLGRQKACHEIRALAATLRSEVTDLQNQARTLRATPAARDGFPMALTTRHRRPVIEP